MGTWFVVAGHNILLQKMTHHSFSEWRKQQKEEDKVNKKIKSLGMENIKIISQTTSINRAKEDLPLEMSASEALLWRWPIHIVRKPHRRRTKVSLET